MPSEDSIEDKISKEFVTTLGYAPKRMRDVTIFVRTLNEFVHFLVTNHYYSDELGKKLSSLSLDLDVLSLNTDRIKLQHEKFSREIERAVIIGKKPSVDQKLVKKMLDELEAIETEGLELNQKTIDCTREIKSDLLKKQGVA